MSVVAFNTRRRTWDDPTADNPGIRIVAPDRRWADTFHRRVETPFASWACGCGATGDATGPNDVMTLQQQYADHKATCGSNG